jgi:hypothetical protein
MALFAFHSQFAPPCPCGSPNNEALELGLLLADLIAHASAAASGTGKV